MMPTDYLWWGVLILANLSDVVIFYLLPYKFLDEKPPFLKHHMMGGIVYGLVMGTLSYYIGSEGHLFQSIIIICVLLFLMYLHRKKHQLKFYELVVIYAVSFLMIGVTRVPGLLISAPFGLTRAIQFLFIITVDIILMLWFCTKRWLTNLYQRIAADVFLQIMMSVLAMVGFGLMFYFNFEISIAFIFLFLLLISFSINTFYQLVPIIYFYTKQQTRLLHDRNTRLMSHHARIYAESDCKKAQKATDEVMEEARIDSSSDGYIKGDNQNNIQTFINKLCEERQTAMKFDTHIHYIAPHTTVTFDEMLYMIGALINNAIDSGRTNYPSFITVSCLKDHLLIKQSNATLDKLTDEKIKKMVKSGSSTKARHGRGYGLYNLKERLKLVRGHLGISAYYDEDFQSDYIEFMITVSAYALSK